MCLTDANTVELLINEFFSQLVQACRDSYSLKINFKIGTLHIHSGGYTQFI